MRLATSTSASTPIICEGNNRGRVGAFLEREKQHWREAEKAANRERERIEQVMSLLSFDEKDHRKNTGSTGNVTDGY